MTPRGEAVGAGAAVDPKLPPGMVVGDAREGSDQQLGALDGADPSIAGDPASGQRRRGRATGDLAERVGEDATCVSAAARGPRSTAAPAGVRSSGPAGSSAARSVSVPRGCRSATIRTGTQRGGCGQVRTQPRVRAGTSVGLDGRGRLQVSASGRLTRSARRPALRHPPTRRMGIRPTGGRGASPRDGYGSRAGAGRAVTGVPPGPPASRW